MSVGPTSITSAGDYHGRPIRRLANGNLWVEVLADAGPRIVRFGRAGCEENLLAETPGAGWQTPHGRYELHGGHRLWFAPENPDLVAVPDGDGLSIAMDGDWICLGGRREPSGLVRSIELQLPDDASVLELRHVILNDGGRTHELAPWAITQLPLGGTVLLPDHPSSGEHAVQPNRLVALWPYASWEDPRFRPLDGLITVAADAGRDFKIGSFSDAGWIAYRRATTTFVRRFTPERGRAHPDLGCNVEVFVGDRYVELEVLGPLTELGPGQSVMHVERWELEATTPETASLRESATNP